MKDEFITWAIAIVYTAVLNVIGVGQPCGEPPLHSNIISESLFSGN